MDRTFVLLLVFASIFFAEIHGHGMCDNLYHSNGQSASDHYFSVIGPRTLRHGDKYKAYVNSMDAEGEKIRIYMFGKATGKKVSCVSDYGNSTTDEFELINDTQMITCEPVGRVENYIMTAEYGTTKQSVEIETVYKPFSVLIQTDKPIYKPKDEVNFRVLVIDSDTKPVSKKGFKITINDIADQIREYYNDTENEENNFINGVFKGKLQLSGEPRTGNWSINVIFDGDEKFTTVHEFEVKEYVLPRFEVIVDTKRYVSQTDEKIRLTVSAKTTFGEFVSGTAGVTARVYDSAFPDKIHQATSKTASVDFKKLVEFDMKKDLRILNQLRPWIVKINVDFEEGLTRQKMTKEVTVRVFRTGEFHLNLLRPQKRFKPGFPFKVTAWVRTHDGSLHTDLYNSVKLTVEFHFRPSLCTEIGEESERTTYTLNKEQKVKNGFTDFIFDVAANTTSFKLTAVYQNERVSINVARHESSTQEYLIVSADPGTLKKSDKFKVKVDFNEAEHFYVLVSGRTGISYHKKYRLSAMETDKKTKSFDIKMKPEMGPSSYVIVYYIQKTGEIIFDSTQINFDVSLRNTMTIKVPQKALPGDECDIEVKTKPNSHIFLLGVDQSVTLFESGFDVTKERVATDLLGNKKTSGLVIQGDPKNTYRKFGDANAFVLTNALEGFVSCLHERIGRNDRIYCEKIVTENEDQSGLVETEEDNDFKSTRVRKNFPETWIFTDAQVDEGGELTLTEVVPDSMTSFILSGFSVHKNSGLGIAVPRKLIVSQDFLIKLYLPYSIRLGEVLKVDVTVFNYIPGKKTVTATVVMHNSEGQYEFVETSVGGRNCVVKPLQVQNKQMIAITIPGGTGAVASFYIRAKVTGIICLIVLAKTPTHKDAVEREMIVAHEGVTNTENKAMLVDLRQNDEFFLATNIPIVSTDTNIVQNSIFIEASAIGDILGPALDNINNLIRLPSGCSEEQFKSWILNIAAARYLKAIGKLTTDKSSQVTQYLSTGYQQVLGRRKSDGSYSLWGEAGDSSVWLTAYVAKLLLHAKEYIAINDKHIVEALDYVKGKQQSDGSFRSSTHNYYYMKTKAQSDVSLTAFVAIAFLENEYRKNEYKTTVDQCLNYIDMNVGKNITDNFVVAISAYALALRNHTSAPGVLEDLIENSVRNDEQWYWIRERGTSTTSENPSVAVEIAAYAIMTLATLGRARETLPIVKWLISQRNSAGGFYSTTDTVVGLQALAMIGFELHSANTNMDIVIKYNNNQRVDFKVNTANAMELQQKEMKPYATDLEVSAVGTGLAYLQVAWRYNSKILQADNSFKLSVDVQQSISTMLHLKICASFIKTENDGDRSSMALIEVQLPSGYIYDPVTADLVKSVGVRRVETEKEKTVIVLYFDSISTTGVCPEIKAIRKQAVASVKKSAVKMYDYYDMNKRASVFYTLNSSNVCEN